MVSAKANFKGILEMLLDKKAVGDAKKGTSMNWYLSTELR